MLKLLHKYGRLIAVSFWLAGVILFVCLGEWNLQASRENYEKSLMNEAGRLAAQVSSLISLTDMEPDEAMARAAVSGLMEDDNVYAVKVETKQGLIAGQRRNEKWEAVPWDDRIGEKSVKGMSPVKIGIEPAGLVSVWLSPRLDDEEYNQLAKREIMRFSLLVLLWTLAFVPFFWQQGDLPRLLHFIRGSSKNEQPEKVEKSAEMIIADLDAAGSEESDINIDSQKIIDARLGRRFLRNNINAWFVTAGLFRQTFASGPALIGRLYSEGEYAGLCHLGRILEQAAPCVGAVRLAEAARQMQEALNDPDCQVKALPVEKCARELEEVLEALSGREQ